VNFWRPKTTEVSEGGIFICRLLKGQCCTYLYFGTAKENCLKIDTLQLLQRKRCFKGRAAAVADGAEYFVEIMSTLIMPTRQIVAIQQNNGK
jgi:hypothetical protein